MTNKYLDLARVYFRKPNSLGINAQIAIKGFARWLDAEHELAPGGSQTQPNTAAPESGTGAASQIEPKAEPMPAGYIECGNCKSRFLADRGGESCVACGHTLNRPSEPTEKRSMAGTQPSGGPAFVLGIDASIEPTAACAHCDGYRSQEGQFFHNPNCKDFVPFHLPSPPQPHQPTPGAIDRPGFLPAEPTEKRSVFVLHMGDYERRHIHSVHSSTEKATEVAKRVMHDWKTPEEPDIDEHEVDPDLCLKCGYEESDHTEYPQTWKHQFVSSRSAVNRGVKP